MNNIENHYDVDPEKEWSRLDKHRLEFEMTKRNLVEFINKPCKILDLGGGPGRYTIFLSKIGHKVTLFDLSKKSLEFARKKAKETDIEIEAIIHGRSSDLSMFDDESFDIVLCMGPLYHLTREDDRITTVNECLRVLKSHGLLFCTFITSYGAMSYYLRAEPESIGKAKDDIEQHLISGLNRVSDSNQGFTDAFFIKPFEVESFMQKFELDRVRITGLEGIAIQSESRLTALSNKDFMIWIDLLYRTSTDQSTWGSSEHMLYVGRK